MKVELNTTTPYKYIFCIFLLVIVTVLSVRLQITASDYTFSIFKLFSRVLKVVYDRCSIRFDASTEWWNIHEVSSAFELCIYI
jgi:hypothetical protein